MVSKTNPATNPGRVRITLATLTVLAMTAAILLLGGTTAQAQSDQGAVPNLRLSSASPGELTISWGAPDPAPSDYRVIWAREDLGFLSYKNSNEANRGNEYPSGAATTITLTGLTKGQTFKVMARTRYTSGGNNNGPWSGPWTDTITTRVNDDPPAAPTGLTAAQVAHDSVTISWTAPSSGSTVTGYRVLRGTDADSLSTIAQDTGSTTVEYTDSTVAAKTTYHYAVLALSQDGDGAQSAALSVTTPAAPKQTKDNRQTQRQSTDTTAPAFASAAASDTSLVITFDEDLAAAASLANSAFTVKKTPMDGAEATVTLSTTVAPVISGKTVTLTLGTALTSTDGSIKVSYTKPTTGSNNKLIDAAANETGREPSPTKP